ncbi:class I histocompatibility antigen, F10 alpha chain-like [Haplochromis burtoni]|uniref:class I histocompatibility antigen, F10 alpha chain-like n=1 Tax=Haplochromis burtoni TaxID=8153 RepID=UPI001C2D04AE|nr:class I histocompatibility antigen, F10 alpha chain-like [Haplochromis burtoni]
MYGCEWDEETGEVNGYEQYGYDGEDFISLDLKTVTWVAPKKQALTTRQKWDNDRGWMAQEKNYLTQICPESLKKYVNYGRSSLMKTVRPSVSLLQKSSSSPVTCHATGFYPNRAEMVWKRDGVELHQGVNKGEILTNNDGTFQMSVDLDVSSVKPEDWDRYRCVFQLSGVNEDIVIRLPGGGNSFSGPDIKLIIPVVVAVVAAVVVLAVIAVIAFIIYKKRTGEKQTSWIFLV